MPAPTPAAAGDQLPAGVISIPDVLASSVRAYRQLRRLEQDDLARRMDSLGHGWRRPTVSEVERSRRNVTVPELVGLALALNVTINELLDPRGPGSRSGPRVALPIKTRYRRVVDGQVVADPEPSDAPWYSVDAEEIGALVCSHQRHAVPYWDGDGLFGGLSHVSDAETADAMRTYGRFGDRGQT